MDSWGRSACYPQGSFYPLSDGPSIRHRRITNPDFRPCSSCCSHSQARFCICTRRLISIQSERTFGRLRYSLGGDRPSQTARLTMSRVVVQRSRLESQQGKGGIPRATPYSLATIFQRLPPILYIPYRNPISSYSKAPRGLSVLLRVTGVFTSTTISPGLLSRQRSDRYTFRAGRNLPDKEFRYLRTVIVTAAVYRGLDSPLRSR